MKGLHVNEATLIAAGVLGFVVLPAAWAGYKLHELTAGPEDKPKKTFSEALKATVSGVVDKVVSRAP